MERSTFSGAIRSEGWERLFEWFQLGQEHQAEGFCDVVDHRLSIDAMKDVARMMKVHLTSILNYFIHHITNARAEGINSKIALTEKMAFGYRNKEHLKYIAVFRCGNLQLYP